MLWIDPTGSWKLPEYKPEKLSEHGSRKTNRRRKFYMSRIVPATSVQTFFSVVLGLTVISIVVFFFTSVESRQLGFEVILGLVGTCIGGVIIVDAFIRRSAMQEMEKGRTTTLATVVDRYVEETHCNYGGTICAYYVVVRFIAVEKEWTLKAMVCRELYDKADQGKLSVIYADSDPRCVLFEGEY